MTKINKLMTSDLQYCTVLDNVYEAAVKMKDADVGAIPIVDEDGATLVGIVTDRDLVLRELLQKAELSKITDAMTERVISAEEDASVEEVLHLMAEHQLRRIPVTKDKNWSALLRSAIFRWLSNQMSKQAGRCLTFLKTAVRRGLSIKHKSRTMQIGCTV